MINCPKTFTNWAIELIDRSVFPQLRTERKNHELFQTFQQSSLTNLTVTFKPYMYEIACYEISYGAEIRIELQCGFWDIAESLH